VTSFTQLHIWDLSISLLFLSKSFQRCSVFANFNCNVFANLTYIIKHTVFNTIPSLFSNILWLFLNRMVYGTEGSNPSHGKIYSYIRIIRKRWVTYIFPIIDFFRGRKTLELGAGFTGKNFQKNIDPSRNSPFGD
jgi:hypothetical protein